MTLTARRVVGDHLIDVDHRHRALIVAGPTLSWPTVDDDTLRDLFVEQNDTRGILARVVADVIGSLYITGREHGCDFMPHRYDRNHEVELRPRRGDGCGLTLNADLDLGADLPHLLLRVPRNLERAWLDRLTKTVDEVEADTVHALTW